MKAYLCGAFSERARVKAMMSRLREAGIEISFDWTADPPPGVTCDADLTAEQRSTYARADLRGVELADVVWLLAPESTSRGAWVEFGYALAVQAITIVSGPAWRSSIFTEVANHTFESDEEALSHLVSVFGGGR